MTVYEEFSMFHEIYIFYLQKMIVQGGHFIK